MLDTTEDEWSVQWFVGSTLLREATFVGENPEIHYIALGKFGDISGSFDYVSLTEGVAVIPEPASVAGLLGAAVGVIAIAVRRRSRAGNSDGKPR